MHNIPSVTSLWTPSLSTNWTLVSPVAGTWACYPTPRLTAWLLGQMPFAIHISWHRLGILSVTTLRHPSSTHQSWIPWSLVVSHMTWMCKWPPGHSTSQPTDPLTSPVSSPNLCLLQYLASRPLTWLDLVQSSNHTITYDIWTPGRTMQSSASSCYYHRERERCDLWSPHEQLTLRLSYTQNVGSHLK